MQNENQAQSYTKMYRDVKLVQDKKSVYAAPHARTLSSSFKRFVISTQSYGCGSFGTVGFAAAHSTQCAGGLGSAFGDGGSLNFGPAYSPEGGDLRGIALDGEGPFAFGEPRRSGPALPTSGDVRLFLF